LTASEWISGIYATSQIKRNRSFPFFLVELFVEVLQPFFFTYRGNKNCFSNEGFLKKSKPLPCSWFEPIKGAKLALSERILARYIV